MIVYNPNPPLFSLTLNLPQLSALGDSQGTMGASLRAKRGVPVYLDGWFGYRWLQGFIWDV